MGVRQALNFCYALLSDGLDTEQRRELDEQIHGWGDEQNRANTALWQERIQGGGEDG